MKVNPYVINEFNKELKNLIDSLNNEDDKKILEYAQKRKQELNNELKEIQIHQIQNDGNLTAEEWSKKDFLEKEIAKHEATISKLETKRKEISKKISEKRLQKEDIKRQLNLEEAQVEIELANIEKEWVETLSKMNDNNDKINKLRIANRELPKESEEFRKNLEEILRLESENKSLQSSIKSINEKSMEIKRKQEDIRTMKSVLETGFISKEIKKPNEPEQKQPEQKPEEQKPEEQKQPEQKPEEQKPEQKQPDLKDPVLEKYKNEGFNQNVMGWYFNPWIDEYDPEYDPHNDKAFNSNIKQESKQPEENVASEAKTEPDGGEPTQEPVGETQAKTEPVVGQPTQETVGGTQAKTEPDGGEPTQEPVGGTQAKTASNVSVAIPLEIIFDAKNKCYKYKQKEEEEYTTISLEDILKDKEFQKFMEGLDDPDLIRIDPLMAYVISRSGNEKALKEYENLFKEKSEATKSLQITYDMHGIYSRKYSSELSKTIMKYANSSKSIKGITVKKGFKTRFLEKFNPIRKLYEKVSKIGQSENLLSLPPVIENYRRKVNIIDKYNNAKEELKNAEGKLKNAKTKEEKEVARKAVQKARDEMLKYDRGPKKTSKNFKDAMKFTPTTSGEKTTSEKEAWGEKTKIITEPEQSEDIPFSSVDLDDSSDGR